MCVTVHALLSALVARIEREGYLASRRELAALLDAGCARQDVLQALARGDSPAFAHARHELDRIPDR